MKTKNLFLVSVAMPTYGQNQFISQAILGVLSQKAEFEIELIIANDCSPDDTEVIVQEIIQNHPNGSWIKYTRHAENKGAIPNFAWSISQAKGKYIAICEGDDYWTDPMKIQKQVDFLENNKDYNIIFHKVKEINPAGNLIHSNILNSPDEEKTYDLKHMAAGNFIHTPSVVFRKNFDELPSWIIYSPLGDYPLHMLNAQYGLIKYLPEEMAVYRVGNGIWSSQSRVNQIVNTMFTVKLLALHFFDKKEIYHLLSNRYKHLLESLTNHNKTLSPEAAAYKLSFKKLFMIIIKKIKHLIK